MSNRYRRLSRSARRNVLKLRISSRADLPRPMQNVDSISVGGVTDDATTTTGWTFSGFQRLTDGLYTQIFLGGSAFGFAQLREDPPLRNRPARAIERAERRSAVLRLATLAQDIRRDWPAMSEPEGSPEGEPSGESNGGEGGNRTHHPARSVGATVLKTVTTTRHVSLSAFDPMPRPRPANLSRSRR